MCAPSGRANSLILRESGNSNPENVTVLQLGRHTLRNEGCGWLKENPGAPRLRACHPQFPDGLSLTMPLGEMTSSTTPEPTAQ